MAHDSDTPVAPATAGPATVGGAGSAMNIAFTAVRDRAYLQRLVRDTVQANTWLGLLYPLGLLLVSVLCFVSGGRAVFAGLVSLLMCGVSWQQMAFPARRVMQGLPPYALEPQEFVINDSALTITSAAVSARMTWATFTRAQERPYAFILFGYGPTYRDVPRSTLTNQQDEQLRRFLIERRLLIPTSGLPLTPPRAEQG